MLALCVGNLPIAQSEYILCGNIIQLEKLMKFIAHFRLIFIFSDVSVEIDTSSPRKRAKLK